MSSSPLIRVGTRGSLLARTQTEWVLSRLREHHPAARFETVVVRTTGDVQTQRRPARLAGQGFFTREIEEALREGRVDLAVHSLKDLPTECPPGLVLGAIPPREDPRDALVGCPLHRLRQDPAAVRLGTSSLRRTAQLRRAFAGCQVTPLRGNLDTRLARVADRTVDGAVLAAAGLHRLGHAADIADYLAPETMLPAPAQGALAVEVRADDDALRELLAAVHCPTTAAAVTAERAFMRGLGGGCHLPVAALAECRDGRLHLRGRVLSLDGQRCLEGACDGAPGAAAELGGRLAAALLAQGADEIVREVEASLPPGADHE